MSQPTLVAAVGCSVLAGLFASACSDDASSERDAGSMRTLSREELLDPETCKECHPNAYREWASSMHAYATDDPVFLAMNARGQREGNIGDFCINCHAPLAVREGYATDGENLDEIPAHLKGVTCYFCHNAERVNGTHNNPIELANDTTMRGGLKDALRPTAHGVQHSKLLDSRELKESSKLCGSCHDIVNTNGVHLERTYAEWQSSIYSRDAKQSCGDCHMEGREGIAADVPGLALPTRRVHSHLFAGVDLALTKFPDATAQRAAAQCLLSTAARVTLCPNPDASFEVRLETNAGHRLPSGASQDRRMWVELVAYDATDAVIFESGVVPEGEVVDKQPGDAGYDKNLWLLRDRIFDAMGNETHMFWEADKSEKYPDGYTSGTLPETLQLGTPHTLERTYRMTRMPARVRVRVHMQAVGREVLDDLVASKDLEPSVAAKIPTLTLTGTVTEWNEAEGFGDCVSTAEPNPLSCPDDYLCELYPELTQCRSK